MISLRNSLGRLLPKGLLVVLIVCLMPARLLAETVTLRNDSRGAVTVQAVTVVKGVVKRDQYLLRIGESTPKLTLNDDKVITIHDPRTGRAVYRRVIYASKKPKALSIIFDRTTGSIRLITAPMMVKPKPKP